MYKFRISDRKEEISSISEEIKYKRSLKKGGDANETNVVHPGKAKKQKNKKRRKKMKEEKGNKKNFKGYLL